MASSGLVVASPPSTATWTFTQGFLLGQASFLVIALLFIRYVVFSPAEPPSDESWKKRRAERAKVSLQSCSRTTGREGQLTPINIVEGKAVDHWCPTPSAEPYPPEDGIRDGHPPCRILRLAQRPHGPDTPGVQERHVVGRWRGRCETEDREDVEPGRSNVVARKSFLPSFRSALLMGGTLQDPIQVTGLSLGAAYPLLSNARVRPADGQGHIVSSHLLTPTRIADICENSEPRSILITSIPSHSPCLLQS